MDIKRSRQLLSLTIIFFWASEYCHVPYFTPYLQTLGFASTIIGFMTGTYGFTQLLVRIPMGVITDATGCYRKTILLGTIFTTVSSFGLIFATSAWSIIVCRVLAGIAASTWLAFTVLYNAYYAADESVTAMTNVNAFNNGGKFIAFILGLVTASIWGYRIPLVCSFITGIIAILFASFLKPIELRRESFKLEHIASVIANPAVLVAALFGIILQGFCQATVFSFTSAVARSIGASAVEIGIATLLYTVIQVVSAGFIGKKLLKRLSTPQALFLGFLFFTLSALSVAFAPHMAFIYLGQILAGLANLALCAVLMSIIVTHVPQEKQSTAMGFYQAIYGIGMAAGPVMVGSVAASRGYTSAYLLAAAITFASALLAPLLAMRYVCKK